MPNIIKNKQLVRMSGNVTEAIQNYRSDVEEDEKKTPSANQAINDLILLGYKLHFKTRIARIERKARAAKASEDGKK